jgi:Carboxypeptidase regulatory-like domain
MLDNHLLTIKTLLYPFKSKASAYLAVILLGAFAIPSLAQGTPPAATANCTVTAMNRTAPLQADYSFTIYNIPGAAAFFGPGTPTPISPFRVRALCSDGTVGETNVAVPDFGGTVVYTGELFWRAATPIPVDVILTAAQNKLTGGQTTKLTTTGVLTNAQTVNLDTRAKGTYYSSSNPLIADVNQDGLATVTAGFATGSSARVIMTAQNEGVAGSTLLQLGERGSLTGKVYWADGTTPVPGARVSIVRNQPRELLGTVVTGSDGSFTMDDVSAGSFSISVIEPSTGDQGRGNGFISTEGDTATANITLNGQGTLTVNVVDGLGSPVSGAEVTFTSLSAFRDIRSLQTNAAGHVVLERAMAGPFTVSTRDDATNLVGTIGAQIRHFMNASI